MQVGVIANPPWVIAENGKIGGVEPELLRELAHGLGAEIRWVQGGQGELLTALEHRQLDAVVGGFNESDPWSSKVAFTKPYYEVAIVVALAPDLPNPERLEDLAVAVESGSAAAGYLRAQDAQPQPVADIETADSPVALPEWQRRSLGYRTLWEIHRARQVIALPPGENAWVVHVERFLNDRRAQVDRLLGADEKVRP